MLLRTAIALFIVSLLGCSKESVVNPYSFLNLRLEGQEEDIKWETITANWTDTLGNAKIEATSYYFDRCTIHLKNITSIGAVSPLTLMQFYYTDGLDFQPYSISGSLSITQANKKAIRGTFNLLFENNYNAVAGKNVKGDFGIINEQ